MDGDADNHHITALTDPRCLDCLYPLRGIPGPRCPECGRPFEPADPTTFAVGGHRTLWQRLAKPPAIWFMPVECGAALALTCWSIYPGGAPEAIGLAVILYEPVCYLVVLLACLDYGIRGWRCLADARRRRGTPAHRRTMAARWLVAPLCILMVALA